MDDQQKRLRRRRSAMASALKKVYLSVGWTMLTNSIKSGFFISFTFVELLTLSGLIWLTPRTGTIPVPVIVTTCN
jgi:hypothetical protein